MKLNLKSRKGFTLIELLVVIGILAVLAAIAIPSVAGLIDRANVSADNTNAKEMTNAIERFASEYELYCQDIASGTLDPDNLDSAQGRVKNVIGVTTRAGIEGIEKPQSAKANATTGVAIYRDTKYPVNAETMKKVVENYTKTSSSTFEPKQSDMHYWYSPDCGVVVFAEPDADIEADLNSQIQSGMDAKGNDLGSTTQWIDLTLGAALSGGSLDLSTVNTDLSTNTWEEVWEISKAGKALEAGWEVGDTKRLKIANFTEWDSNEGCYKASAPKTETATLISIGQDGSGTTTWMITTPGGIGYQVMNPYDDDIGYATNEGGWSASKMRALLNNDIYNSMSNKDYIKSVSKMTNNTGYQGTTATSTSDKVFLLSPKEAGVADDIAGWSWYPEEYKPVLETEGTTYTWFESNTVDGWFWLRSPYSDGNHIFFFYGDGDLDYSGAYGECTVCPAFVIG